MPLRLQEMALPMYFKLHQNILYFETKKKKTLKKKNTKKKLEHLRKANWGPYENFFNFLSSTPFTPLPNLLN